MKALRTIWTGGVATYRLLNHATFGFLGHLLACSMFFVGWGAFGIIVFHLLVAFGADI